MPKKNVLSFVVQLGTFLNILCLVKMVADM